MVPHVWTIPKSMFKGRKLGLSEQMDDQNMALRQMTDPWLGCTPHSTDPASYAVAWNQMVVVSWWSWSWWSCHVTDRGPLGYEVKLQSNCACLGRKKLADSYRFVQRHLSGIKSVLWFFEKLENHRLWMRFKLPLYFLFQHLQMFVPSNSLRSQPKAVQNHGRSASRLTLADHSSEACCWTEILHLYLDPKILGIPTR